MPGIDQSEASIITCQEDQEAKDPDQVMEEDIEVIVTLGGRRRGPSHCRSRDPDVGCVVIIIVFSCSY